MSKAPKKKTTMSRLGKVAVVAGSVAALAVGLAGSADAAILKPLTQKAGTFELKYMPEFDYDSDSCFPAAAVDASGHLNGGLKNSGSITGGCRTNHLGKANTYTQSWCKNGWCAYIYALYFEKDQTLNGADAFGHRNDWENVIVFQKQGEEKPRYIAASRHHGYSTHAVKDVPMDGNHVQIVYHKDGAGTHAFRFAKWGERPQAWGNGGWDKPALVDIHQMDDTPRNALWNSKWGKANFPLTGNFQDNINKARPSEVPAF
ncbi:NPP1 family protein [Streptomyces sp900129855]|uniref:NPP1 family protein n=1 Tax=Streptomyces sp. 900129855 TaxID=3155129 RepID=A0ABV2ZQ91_9ACTN